MQAKRRSRLGVSEEEASIMGAYYPASWCEPQAKKTHRCGWVLKGAVAAPKGKTVRCAGLLRQPSARPRSEEHTSELQSLMRISYAVFCLKKKNHTQHKQNITHTPELASKT